MQNIFADDEAFFQCVCGCECVCVRVVYVWVCVCMCVYKLSTGNFPRSDVFLYSRNKG